MKNKNYDIFDLNHLDDLSKQTKQELSIKKAYGDAKLFILLFEIKKELSVDEIIVGFYRKYGINKTRKWVVSTIYNLKRRKIIKEVGNKIYSILPYKES